MIHENVNVEKPQYFIVDAYVAYVKNDDKIYYHACPTESCKRKVYEESAGWKCESCNKYY